MTAGPRERCTVLVASCDAYRDVERAFAALWRKFWPDCPFETVVVAESPREGAGFDRWVATGPGKTWCAMLAEALATVRTGYVLMVMNDYFLSSPVDTARILSRLAEAERFGAATLRLNPVPPGRRPWPGSDLLEYPKDAAYSVTCQTSFWARDFLLSLAARNASAWEFERRGSFQLADETRPLLVTRTREFPFADAVHKGYWERRGVEIMRENSVACDFSRRTLPPPGVRFAEGLKRLVFAVFPVTPVVRIQNLLNVGKK